MSYGAQGGVRAVEHLRVVLGELKVADIRSQVALTLADEFARAGRGISGKQDFTPRTEAEASLTVMLDELLSWAGR